MTASQKKEKRKRVRAMYLKKRYINQAPQRKERAENQEWFKQFLNINNE